VMQSGNFEMVKETIEMFPELVNVEIDDQKTLPIHLAAQLGHIKMVRLLEEKGVNLVEKDSHQHTPLYYAIRVRDEKTVEFLLEKRVSIGAQELVIATAEDEIFTSLLKENPSQMLLDEALYQAVDAHDMVAFMKLHRAGASFSHCTPDGWTPTLRASHLGEQEMLGEILKRQPIDVREMGGNSPLHMACLQGHSGCAEILVRAGFCPNQPNGSGKSALDISQGTVVLKNALHTENDEVESTIAEFTKALFSLGQENDETVSQEPSDDETPLLAAMRKFSLALEKAILLMQKLPKDERVCIEAEGKRAWGTPLQLFIRFRSFSFVEGIIDSELLSRFFSSVPSDPNIVDSQGETLAHVCLRKGIDPCGIEGIRFDIPNHQGQMPLHIAAESSEDKILEKILENVPQSALEAEDNEGKTPIFYALIEKMRDESKSEDKLRRLIEKRINLDHTDHLLRTPLVLATGGSLLSMVRFLVEKGADVNQVATLARVSPLHAAIAKREQEIFRYLLFHGANPNRLIDGGTHSMHLAAERGEVEMMAMLAARGVSLDVQDFKGAQPKHQAAACGKVDVLEAMRRLQIDDDARSIDARREFLDKDQAGRGVFEGMTPMQAAAFHGHSDTVKWFLDNHADPEARNTKGFDALFLAARGAAAPAVFEKFKPYRIMGDPKSILPALVSAIDSDHLEGMIYLYQRGASVNSPLVEKETGLHCACRSGALECSAWLLHNGADPTCDNSESQNAFEISAANPSAEQFQLLLDYTQVDPNNLQHNTHTLLHIAVRAGRLKNAMLLMVRGAEVDIPNSGGKTSLHVAVEEGHLDLTRFLLACGANAQAEDRAGRVPIELADEEDQGTFGDLFTEFERVRVMSKEGDSRLHFAVRCGHPLAVLTLAQTEHVEERNCEGQTALQLALQGGETELSRLLRLGACQVEM